MSEERQARGIGLVHRLFHVLDEWLDRSILGSCWQQGKWRFAYTFRKNNRVPAFEDLIQQPHRGALVDTVLKLGCIMSLLEVGCGRGANLYLLSRAIPGITLYGVDISSAAIAQARRELEVRSVPGVQLDEGSGDALTAFGNRSMDVVVADAVTMYLPPPRISHVLQEMLRVARKAIVIGAWHFDASANTEPYLYTEGAWVYDYRRLLEQCICVRAKIDPYPDSVWSNERWNRYGVLVTVYLEE